MVHSITETIYNQKMTKTSPIKDYSWYPPLAMRTCKDMPTLKSHIAHMCMGIASEFLEFYLAQTQENSDEEKGDIMWYVSGICNSLNIPFIAGDKEQEISYLRESFEVVENIISACKKYYVYGVDIDIEQLTTLCQNLIFIMDCDNNLEEILKNNLEKLKVRYPEYYTDQLAVERLDKTNT